MSKLSTHALDTALGRPAAGMPLALKKDQGDGRWKTLVETVTNSDGRTDAPLLEGSTMVKGSYEIVFSVGSYLRSQGTESPFLEDVPIRFKVDDPDQGYHVPLLCSPWSYSTYRGS